MGVVLPLLPRWIRWLGFLTVAGVLFYASIMVEPAEVVAEEDDPFGMLADVIGFGADHWRHFLAYGVLAYSLAYATDHWPYEEWTYGRLTMAAFVVLVCTAYGAAIEVGQAFVPYRFYELSDILANSLGAVLVLPWYYVRPRLELKPVPAFVRTVRERFVSP